MIRKRNLKPIELECDNGVNYKGPDYIKSKATRTSNLDASKISIYTRYTPCRVCDEKYDGIVIPLELASKGDIPDTELERSRDRMQLLENRIATELSIKFRFESRLGRLIRCGKLTKKEAEELRGTCRHHIIERIAYVNSLIDKLKLS